MQKNNFKWFSLILLCIAVASCNVTKKLPKGELLYTGAQLDIDKKGNIPQKQELYAKLNDQLRPESNKKFLGIAYTRLWLNQHIKEPKKEKGLRKWLKYKIGNEPVLYSTVEPEQVKLFLRKTLQDYGHFHANIEPEEIIENSKAEFIYKIELETPYKIDSVIPPSGNKEVDSLVRQYIEEEKLRNFEGKVYHLSDWEETRKSIRSYVRNNGYYKFSDRYIYYFIDTAMQDRKLNVHVRTTSVEDSSIYKQFHIRNINVNAAYRLESQQELISTEYKGIEYLQGYEYVKPSALHPFIAFQSGKIFRQKDHSYTLDQLLLLNIFKFVNIQYKVVGDSLDVKILLTPTQYQDVNADLEASSTNTNFLGTNIQLSYINHHLFKRANQFEIILNAGSEFQFSGQQSNVNIIDISGQLNYYLPKMLGFSGWQKRRQLRNPKTKISFTNNFERWFDLYTLNSVNLNLGYNWTDQNGIFHELTPFSFTRVNLLRSGEKLDELLETNVALRTSFEEVLIIGQKYNFQHSTKEPGRPLKEHLWFNLELETAGNLMYSAYELFSGSEKPHAPFAVPFSQFALGDFDVRHYWVINEKNSFVSRINTGLGVAYGNSNVLPYIKQLYLGGPSSLRAFRFRGVGPGTYRNPNFEDNVNAIDQAGDIKLLLNLEYRFTLYRFLKAALFADIGNVWLLRNDPERPGGVFKFDEFYNQFAIGTGLGIRLDFDIFVIRLDIGVPLRKPYLPEGEEWINKFPQTGFSEWRKSNLIWNLAIGYPF